METKLFFSSDKSNISWLPEGLIIKSRKYEMKLKFQGTLKYSLGINSIFDGNIFIEKYNKYTILDKEDLKIIRRIIKNKNIKVLLNVYPKISSEGISLFECENDLPNLKNPKIELFVNSEKILFTPSIEFSGL